MSRSQLTSFEHVLLGMIFIQPASGYDLKRRFVTSPMGVYQPSSGALYPALERLERRGLLLSEALRPASGGLPLGGSPAPPGPLPAPPRPLVRALARRSRPPPLPP